MSLKDNGFYSFFKALFIALIAVSGLAFLISATVSSLFGYSLWSWLNLLRFFLGSAILFMLFAYFYILRGLAFDKKKKD